MLTITSKAAAHLHEIASSSDKEYGIRISLMGSSGFGLTADIVKDDDHITLCGDIQVIVDRKLLEYCRAITIDFREGDPDGCSSKSGRGFTITAEQAVVF